MRRAAGAVAVLAACVAAAFLVAAGGSEQGKRYRILFDSAFGIVEGADFKVAGVRAGKVENFDLSDGYPPRAVVEVVVEEPGLQALRSDARCEVKPQSLIGEYFVDCVPGSSDEPLRDDTVPVEQTAGTIPLDLVNNILRQPQRDRLPLILNALGAGLAGRSEDVAEVLERAHPGLRETNETLRILARQDEILERFVISSERVVGVLADRRRDVVDFVREAGETAEISASRRQDIATSIDRLDDFLGELEPTMTSLGELADAQVPVLANLRRAAPALDETLRRLGPFSRSSRTALLSLGDLSRTGSRALAASDEEIRELRDLADGAPELGKPLRQFLQTLDDRERSIEPDPRSARSAPPAPDPTADTEGRGFTGFESAFNYAFWQTLAINAFDSVSHVLRFTITANDCSPYAVTASEEKQRSCASWMGPYQPGITAPDPTADPAQARPPTGEGRAGRDRAAGDAPATGGAPEAPPLQGRRDLSRPQLVLPEELRELLGRVGRDPAPRTPGAEQLLDFLLLP